MGTSVLAHGVKTKTIEIDHPWTFGADVAGADVEVCATIKNIGRGSDRLIGARTPLAKTVEIVEPESDGKSGPTRAIEMRPGARVELRLSGRRLLLRAFAKALPPWDSFPLTLVFEKAGPIEVEVLVEERTR
jgi:copper(I)-binding protein